MAIKESRRLGATQQQVWDILRSPEALQRTMPGLSLLEPQGPDRYRWSAEVQGGQLSGHLQGNASVGDKHVPQSVVLTFDGVAQDGVAWQGGAHLRLAEAAAGECNLACTIHATATGADQHVVDALVASLVDDFLARLGVEVQIQHPPQGADTQLDEDDFASTLMTDQPPEGRAGSALYKDDKKFPTWVWPVLALVLLGLWWLGR